MNPADDAFSHEAGFFQPDVPCTSFYRARCSNFEKRMGPVVDSEEAVVT